MSNNGFLTDEFKKEFEEKLAALKRSCIDDGIDIGIERTLRLIFDQTHHLKEQCHMCRNNQHDRCLIYKTFLLVELSYECNCSCQSTIDLRKRLRAALEELEKERTRRS